MSIDTVAGQNLSMLNIYSMTFWIIAIALMFSSLIKKLEVLVMAVFPVSALLVVLSSMSTDHHIIDASSPGYLIHILIAIASISILGLAAIQSVFVTMLDNRLKRAPTKINLALPALQDMEKFLYFLVAFGFVLLSLAIITAILFMPSTGGGIPLHKPILSVISWLVFAVFLVGRFKKGWRGKIAASWTITGFLFLFLAYFGTRTVIEFILG